MIVSALLTSVGINLGLCVLFIALYSSLRKQPSNYDVYIPRLLADGRAQQRSRFDLERLLPTPGWIRQAWQLSEEGLLESSGLDAVVFMRIIILSLRVFCLAGIIGVFVLLPVNCTGNQLQNINLDNFTNDSLDIFTISNVDDGSTRLWIHFCAIYIVTIFVCYLLYYEYGYISSMRVNYFYSSKPQPNQFTILVRSIPISVGTSVSDSVEGFFTEYYPSTYLSHTVIRRTSKLRSLINVYQRLVHLPSEPTRVKVERDGCCGLFRRKVDPNHHQEKLEVLEENLRLEQSKVLLAGQKEVGAAFVSFTSRYSAAICSNMQQSVDPTQWITEQAPEPHDVYWPFFSSTFMGRWISKLVVVVACIILTILFIVPVLFVQGLTNLNQLEVWFPFLKEILSIAFVSQVITGYLPSLILQLFLKMVPPIMKFLSSIQGYISNSGIEKSACNKVLWFTIWNIFFGNVLSGSVFSQLYIFLDPKTIPMTLAVAVPAQASFFIAYVVTQGWTSLSSELFRLIPFICSLIKSPCTRSSDDDFEVPSPPYHSDIPRLLFFGLLGITYFFQAPLILPFLLSYFCLGYIIYRNQLINVYAPKYETAGKFWPIVHNAMIFSLILMHAIALGIFVLKELPLASAFIIPLPIFTLLFNAYCRNRFLPIFDSYSTESLIKKDRSDCHDATMAEFFDKLKTAYQDPALLPIRFSANRENRNSPLISSEEV